LQQLNLTEQQSLIKEGKYKKITINLIESLVEIYLIIIALIIRLQSMLKSLILTVPPIKEEIMLVYSRISSLSIRVMLEVLSKKEFL
jgi:hypothetical protein